MAEQRALLSGRSIFGLAIVALGVALTLDNLGLIRFDDFWQFWPVALILVGVSKLAAGQPGRGFFWLALGAAFLLPVVFEEVEWEDLWDYWPLMLIALGVSMVVRSFFPDRAGRRDRPAGVDKADRADAGTSAADVQVLALLSNVRRSVTSSEFRHGDLTALLGGCDVDLTGAELAPEGAVVEIFAFWGGVVLRVPDHWVVDPQLAVLMGAVEDSTKPGPGTGGRLTVKGLALMGGLEIRN